MSSAQIDEHVLIHDTNSSRVRSALTRNEQASGDDLLSGRAPQLREENDLNQIYKVTDFVCNNLGSSSKQWLKAKLQLMCAQSLLRELHAQGDDQRGAMPREKIKMLADMLKPIMQFVLGYEDHWNGLIYDEGAVKNLVTSLAQQELTGLTQLRLKYLLFFLDLSQRGLDYEPIKEVFKKKQLAVKQLDQAAGSQAEAQGDHSGPGVVPYELHILFERSKNLYVSVLCASIEQQLDRYRQLRDIVQQSIDQLEDDNKWKAQAARIAKEQFESMRRALQVTKDNAPPQLKEVFDIFLEVHSKKGFLVTRKLISEAQRQQIAQAVLYCCAMCGPDNLNPNDAAKSVTSAKFKVKFLDLCKLQSPAYQLEGLTICLQWYLEVLDRQSIKKNQDFHRRLKVVLEEIKLRASQSQKALPTLPQISTLHPS